MRALLWPLFSRSACAQPDNVVKGTSCEGDDLISVRSVGVVSASQCGCGQERSGRCSGLCSIGRRGARQTLLWRAHQVSAVLCPMLAWSAWAQTATVLAGKTGKSAALASVRSVGMGSAKLATTVAC